MKALLQRNYRHPQVLSDGTLFYIKEQQMDVEWLAQDAWNWTLSFHGKSTRITDGWVPVRTSVDFTYVDDPDRFSATYTVTYVEKFPRPEASISAEAAAAAFYLLIMGFPGLFIRELQKIWIAALLAGISKEAEDVWSYAYTPGTGDGSALRVWSYERAVQLYIKELEDQGLI